MAGATRGSRAITLLLLAVCSFAFAATELRALHANRNPEEADTTAFLGEANLPVVREGPLAFLAALYSGAWAQRNQHPLYVAALAPFASRELAFVKRAQLASAAFGLLGVIGVFALGLRLGGPLCGAAPVLALALTPEYVRWSTLVASESLLVLASVASFHAIVSALRGDRLAWPTAGAALGLAYLSKGSGLFLLPGIALALPFARAQGRRLLCGSLLLALLFGLVASPLLVRNAVRFGNPLENVNTTKLAYTEAELDTLVYTLFDPETGQGQNVYSARPKNTAHPEGRALELGQRLASGLLDELVALQQALLIVPVNHVPSDAARALFTVLVLALFSYGLAQERNGAAGVYFAATLGCFLVALTLFRPHARYLFPVVPLVWIFASMGALRSLAPRAEKVLAAVAIAVALLVAAQSLVELEEGRLADAIDDEPARREILAWLRANLAGGERYAEGPNLNWQLERGTWVLAPRADRQDLARFNAFAARLDVRYLVLDWQSLTRSRHRGGGVDRQALLAPHVRLDPERGLVFRSPLPGWTVLLRDPRVPSRYAILRRARQPRLPESPAVHEAARARASAPASVRLTGDASASSPPLEMP